MKTSQLIVLACCLGHISASPAGTAPVMRDAATHETLSKELQLAELADPMKKLVVATGEDPSKQEKPADLLSRSDMISFNGMATLVPKRAIISMPEKLKARLVHDAGSRLVPWSEFLVANRSWINTEEVTYQQAAGSEALSEETTGRMAKSNNLVVATYLGGPISVAEPTPVSPPSPEAKN